eukprot:1187292-Prorocentrum_minimum.AAC.2
MQTVVAQTTTTPRLAGGPSKGSSFHGTALRAASGRRSDVSRTALTVSASGEKAKIAVLGASGYTGSEIVRLLAVHPNMEVSHLTAFSNAGKKFDSVYPQHRNLKGLPVLIKDDEVDYSTCDAVFCCLPHGTTQQIVAGLPSSTKVVDLSADFRLRDPEMYAKWCVPTWCCSTDHWLRRHTNCALPIWYGGACATRLGSNPSPAPLCEANCNPC